MVNLTGIVQRVGARESNGGVHFHEVHVRVLDEVYAVFVRDSTIAEELKKHAVPPHKREQARKLQITCDQQPKRYLDVSSADVIEFDGLVGWVTSFEDAKET
jgi:hypothetical protein